MKIATWNVNGIRARESQFIEWVAQHAPEVICLQELKAAPEQIPDACKLDDYITYWHGQKGYSGVSLHIRKGAFEGEPGFMHPGLDMERRIVEATLGDLVVASVYVPNGGKDYDAKIDFMKKLAAYTKSVQESGRKLVICGDMNVTRTDRDVHPKERKAGAIGQRDDERAIFEEIIGTHLVDVGRAMDPENENLFTWWAPWRNMRQRNIGWRIDYILASKDVADRAVSCCVHAAYGTSDHAPVVMEVA